MSLGRTPTTTGVLYLAPWVTIGGSDRNTVDWLRVIDHDRFRPYLVATQESPNERFGEAARHAVEAWALPDLMPGRAMPRFIAELVASRGIRVLHVMNSRLGFDLVPALKAAFPRLRAVAQLHAEEHPAGTGYPRYVASHLDRHIDAYSVISETLKQRLVDYGVSPEKQRVIRLGVDVEAFRTEVVEPCPVGRRDGELHVLYPARLTWQKDPLLMVEVARRLRERGSSAVIHVVGDGDLRHDVEAAIDRHGLRDQVRLHGAVLDMPPWYAAVDAVLLTSRYEGIPLALFEAFAMGRPVVAAAVGGTAEVLDDTVGFLIRDRDDPDAFADALLRLEADPELRASIGAAGRERAVREFSVDRMARAHEELYLELATTAPPPSAEPDLAAFDDWWAEDTVPLVLGLDEHGASSLSADSGTLARAVRVGRIFNRAFAGTAPLVESDGVYRMGEKAGGRVVGHVLSYGLPGMVDLWSASRAGATVLGVPEPVIVSDVAPWVDTPDLLPAAAAPRRRWRRRQRPRSWSRIAQLLGDPGPRNGDST